MVGPVYQDSSLFEFSSGYFPNVIFESLSIFMLGRHLEALIMALRRKLSSSPLDVDWILGACMLISKKDFDQAGGFDTDFFLFFEEIDLCKRIRDDGGVISVATDCRINHIGSVSGKKDYALFTERFYQGKLRYLDKQTIGFRRILLLRLVWLQLHSQRLLWSILTFLWPDKSEQKIRGLTRALAFYRTTV
jgi:GT2 family glycosyltransferase